MKPALTLFALGVTSACAALAADTEMASVSFLACPIARDTGPDTDVCFFTEHGGKRYSLRTPIDWGSPQLGHQVLVEGRVASGPLVCGGIPLDGRISVMPELDAGCQMIVPADPAVPPVLPPVTEARRAQIAERVRRAEQEPETSLLPLELLPSPPVVVAADGTDTIYYPFESDRSSGPDTQRFVVLAQLLMKLPALRVTITGFRGASRLDDGSVLMESEGMAAQRAQKVAGILVGLGVPRNRVATRAAAIVATPTGQEDWKSRRIEIATGQR